MVKRVGTARSDRARWALLSAAAAAAIVAACAGRSSTTRPPGSEKTAFAQSEPPCDEAPQMLSRVHEARAKITEYAKAGKPLSLWSLMFMADVTPTRGADAVRLGLRDPFVITAVDGGASFVSHVTDSAASCTVAAPGCLVPTFPLYFKSSVGEATPHLGQDLTARVAFRADATEIAIEPPLEIGLANIGALPVQSVALKRIDLSDTKLHYEVIASIGGFHFPLSIDLMLSGHCPSPAN